MGASPYADPKAYSQLHRELSKRFPVSTLAFGSDASFYRPIPKLVVKVINEEEAMFVLVAGHRLRSGRKKGFDLPILSTATSPTILEIRVKSGRRVRIVPLR